MCAKNRAFVLLTYDPPPPNVLRRDLHLTRVLLIRVRRYCKISPFIVIRDDFCKKSRNLNIRYADSVCAKGALFDEKSSDQSVKSTETLATTGSAVKPELI